MRAEQVPDLKIYLFSFFLFIYTFFSNFTSYQTHQKCMVLCNGCLATQWDEQTQFYLGVKQSEVQ